MVLTRRRRQRLARTLEALAWLGIYGGLVALTIGLFAGRAHALLGGTLVGLGLVACVAGAALVGLRSRVDDAGDAGR
jgi:hypothetical protein